ncbi:MAG: hypothetical protein M1504_03775 [Candidatus Marsarchaeota archaeon]|nr:hypothetical protein [Candidatus Marsarchaeota archaeon]
MKPVALYVTSMIIAAILGVASAYVINGAPSFTAVQVSASNHTTTSNSATNNTSSLTSCNDYQLTTTHSYAYIKKSCAWPGGAMIVQLTAGTSNATVVVSSSKGNISVNTRACGYSENETSLPSGNYSIVMNTYSAAPSATCGTTATFNITKG